MARWPGGKTRGRFLEWRGEWDPLGVQLGLRHDRPEDFSGETSYRTQITWKPADSLELFGAYSEGFKLPSFFALAHPLVGNPDLAPELSENAEAGLRFANDPAFQFEVVLFRNEFTDLVDFDPERFTSVNRSSVVSKGVEWRAETPLTAWLSLQVDVSYLDIHIRESDSVLRRRPDWTGSAYLHAALDPWDLSLSAHSRGEFYDSAIATGLVELPAYAEVNAAAQWQWNETLTLTFNIDNILNERYEESVGFRDPGRQWRVGLRYYF